MDRKRSVEYSSVCLAAPVFRCKSHSQLYMCFLLELPPFSVLRHRALDSAVLVREDAGYGFT